MLARTLKGKADKKLYLFDSFRGLPKVDEHRDQWFSEHDFSIESVQGIRNMLAEFYSIIDIRQRSCPCWCLNCTRSILMTGIRMRASLEAENSVTL